MQCITYGYMFVGRCFLDPLLGGGACSYHSYKKPVTLLQDKPRTPNCDITAKTCDITAWGLWYHGKSLWYHGQNLWYHGPALPKMRNIRLNCYPQICDITETSCDITKLSFVIIAFAILVLTPVLSRIPLGWGWVQLPCPGCAWLCGRGGVFCVCPLVRPCLHALAVVFWLAFVGL